MKKLLIIGSPGAGKSTLTRQLADKNQLPIIHLDKLYHQPDRWPEGTSQKRGEWIKLIQKLVKEDGWIMDGNYGSTLGIRIPAADLVIFLDYPRRISLRRAFVRALLKTERPDMPSGWQEKLNWHLFKKIWNFKRSHRQQIINALAVRGENTYIILKTPRATRHFLKNTPIRSGY